MDRLKLTEGDDADDCEVSEQLIGFGARKSCLKEVFSSARRLW